MQQLAGWLISKNGVLAVHKGESIGMPYHLAALCDRLAEFDELDETIEQLKSLRITEDDDHDEAKV